VSHDGEPDWKLKSGIKSIVHIRSHPSYVGPMNGKDAEIMLKQAGGDCYLLRYSESHKKIKLSVLSYAPFFQHFRIKTTTNQDQSEYEIEGTTKIFQSCWSTMSRILLTTKSAR
jgi:hypothetical protein